MDYVSGPPVSAIAPGDARTLEIAKDFASGIMARRACKAIPRDVMIISKGEGQERAQCSAFDETGLAAHLRNLGVLACLLSDSPKTFA